MSKKIGIMGGTFNPIHLGHLMIAQEALSEIHLDKVLFIPTGCPYLKNLSTIAESKHRLEMAKLAVADNPYFEVSDIEIRRDGNTYTCDTLKELLESSNGTDAISDEMPNKYYLIFGADTFLYLDHWKYPEYLFSHSEILVSVRDEHDEAELSIKKAEYEEKYNARISLLIPRAIDISSTQIRDDVNKGKSVKYQIPDSVIKYIRQHQLYQED